jgi:hypothetical protein
MLLVEFILLSSFLHFLYVPKGGFPQSLISHITGGIKLLSSVLVVRDNRNTLK